MVWKNWALAIVVIALVVMFVGGTALSSTGHSIKARFNGTILEQPGEAIENAGQSLINSFYVVLGFIVVIGILAVGLATRNHY